MFKQLVTLVASAGALALIAADARGDEYQNLAKSLASLRGEVEMRSGELAARKGALQDEVRTLARQQSELALELDREQIKLKKLRLSIAQQKKRVEEERARSKVLSPVVAHVATRVREHIHTSLPFRSEERLAEVTKIETQVQAGLLTPPKAVARIWAVVEDELRMTRDAGIFRQTIELHGQEQLADVLRVGMIMLFYRAGDGSVGYAQRQGDGWTFGAMDDPGDVALVEGVFGSFKKQIRQGYFEVPNALAIGGNREL